MKTLAQRLLSDEFVAKATARTDPPKVRRPRRFSYVTRAEVEAHFEAERAHRARLEGLKYLIARHAARQSSPTPTRARAVCAVKPPARRSARARRPAGRRRAVQRSSARAGDPPEPGGSDGDGATEGAVAWLAGHGDVEIASAFAVEFPQDRWIEEGF
jgi:hypothetical protein